MFMLLRRQQHLQSKCPFGQPGGAGGAGGAGGGGGGCAGSSNRSPWDESSEESPTLLLSHRTQRGDVQLNQLKAV